MVPSCIHFF
jgi:hypothetical protein